MTFFSTKRFGPISTGHRQWRDNGHCARIHGYGRYVQIVFQGEVDHRQWVMDFGDLKHIRQTIETAWDHNVLIASDDPQLEHLLELQKLGVLQITLMDVTQGHGPGIEGSAKWVYDWANPWVVAHTEGRVSIASVTVWEHDNNSAIYQP